jgi:lysophospholipase L1-like esterase
VTNVPAGSWLTCAEAKSAFEYLYLPFRVLIRLLSRSTVTRMFQKQLIPRFVAGLVVFGCWLSLVGQPQAGQHWVAIWTAAQQASGLGNAGFDNQTIRLVVHTSVGGEWVRVRLSNAFGTTPLAVGAVHIALREHAGTIIASTDHGLTFKGNTSVIVPSGAPMISDPVQIEIPAAADIAVSIYVSGVTGRPTCHVLGLETTYISGPGNFTDRTVIPSATTSNSSFFLSEVDVVKPIAAYSVAALGDSITDGYGSTANTNQRWPDILASRISSTSVGKLVAFVNEGISGNRILHDDDGPNALARFDRDVLAVDGVRVLIVIEGINDIGWPDEVNRRYVNQRVTADEIIGGLHQIIDRAHAHGIRVLGATLTPYGGAAYAAASGEAKREAVNAWIREADHFDGVIDFDAALRDPNHVTRLASQYDSGDHLHPNDEGYRAMANATDLQSLTPSDSAK